jgi:hypothetical protein
VLRCNRKPMAILRSYNELVFMRRTLAQ